MDTYTDRRTASPCPTLDDIAMRYLDAKSTVLRAGYAWEIDWQESCAIGALTEQRVLREFAWVVLSSGLSERVVRSIFIRITEAFQGWSSARSIWLSRQGCRRDAMHVIRSERKIDAILALAGYVHYVGFPHFMDALKSCECTTFLQRFPMLGPATSRHLAKNLGVPVAKPDRHLCRIASAVGYRDVARLCNDLSETVGDPVSVVDVVLWRFATLDRGYLRAFQTCRHQD